MPAEPLVCVWQAAYARHPELKSLTKENIEELTHHFSVQLSCAFDKDKFNEVFPGSTKINFSTYRDYITRTLTTDNNKENVDTTALHEKIENQCWSLSKELYKSDILHEEHTKKLWQIVNRLSNSAYPPTVCPEAVVWLTDKIASSLGKQWQPEQKEQHAMTFAEILSFLEGTFFVYFPADSVKRTINELSDLLVNEIIKTGWMYKRTKKQANWTNWVKRWFLLTPTYLAYYKEIPKQSGGNKAVYGAFYITPLTTVAVLPDYRGLVHKLNDRFKVSNLPQTEMEMAPADNLTIRNGWIAAIRGTIDASKTGISPMRSLIRKRYSENIAQSPLPDIVIDISDSFSLHSEPEVKTQVLGEKIRPEVKVDNTKNETNELASEVEGKIKTIFMKIDLDGNGKIDENEFSSFFKGLGLEMNKNEERLIFESIDKDDPDFITFGEFADYFANVIMDEDDDVGLQESRLRKAFLEADHDGTCTLNFKEVCEHVWEKRRSIRVSKLFMAFEEMDSRKDGVVSYDEFRHYYQRRLSDVPINKQTEEDVKSKDSTCFETRLQDVYKETDANELAAFIRDRWNKFATFRRKGATGQTVMRGGHGMVADIVPGEYSLVDLANFSDLPPLIPKHASIKGIKWVSATEGKGKSGKILFPIDFDGKIPIDTATDELLRYYGCHFAEGQGLKISLMYRHGIQDFTYENKYMEEYVQSSNGGAGIERHEFTHLDCPLDQDSGIFLLAKLIGDDEIHITGFKIPLRHTLYIPGGVIHSNDYLQGTWRTMLSDEADIDHVHLVRPKDNEFEHFKFSFYTK